MQELYLYQNDQKLGRQSWAAEWNSSADYVQVQTTPKPKKISCALRNIGILSYSAKRLSVRGNAYIHGVGNVKLLAKLVGSRRALTYTFNMDKLLANYDLLISSLRKSNPFATHILNTDDSDRALPISPHILLRPRRFHISQVCNQDSGSVQRNIYSPWDQRTHAFLPSLTSSLKHEYMRVSYISWANLVLVKVLGQVRTLFCWFHIVFDVMVSLLVITGASDGIGREYAIQLAKKGFNVLVVARNESALSAVTDEIGMLHLTLSSVLLSCMINSCPLRFHVN
jgi:hypothetical protein